MQVLNLRLFNILSKREFLKLNMGEYVKFSDKLTERAKEIAGFGIRGIDALHIAMAEVANADYFVTCDDDIIKRVRELAERFKVKICGVLEFLEEVMGYGKDNKRN